MEFHNNTFIYIIRHLYVGFTCQDIHGLASDPFPVSTGVGEKCLLSCLLCLMEIDWVSKTSYDEPLGTKWTLQSCLEDLDFADDICHIFLIRRKNIQPRTKNIFPYSSFIIYERMVKTISPLSETKNTNQMISVLMFYSSPVWHLIPLIQWISWTRTNIIKTWTCFPEQHHLYSQDLVFPYPYPSWNVIWSHHYCTTK